MRRFVVLAAVVALWPREGIVGTYGAFRLPQRGFTLAVEIAIGSMSNHADEGPQLEAEEKALEGRLRPLAPTYTAWFDQRLADPRWRGWFDGLDRRRSTEGGHDFQYRLPAPVPVSELATDEVDLWLHTKPSARGLVRGRALVGFALSAIAAPCPQA